MALILLLDFAIYLANNNLESALLSTNKYILCKPDDKYGIYLKFEIYYSLVRVSIFEYKAKEYC